MMIEMMHGIVKEKDIAAATAILHACFLDCWLTVCSPVDRLIHPLQMLLSLWPIPLQGVHAQHAPCSCGM